MISIGYKSLFSLEKKIQCFQTLTPTVYSVQNQPQNHTVDHDYTVYSVELTVEPTVELE